MSAEPKRVELTEAERERLAIRLHDAFFATEGHRVGKAVWLALADAVQAAGWVSPEEHCAELDGARAEVERHAQRAEKAEAEVKHIKSTMVGHFRVHAETIARIQDAKATIARVEALAEKWDRPSMVGIASGIRAALAEPERDEEGS